MSHNQGLEGSAEQRRCSVPVTLRVQHPRPAVDMA